MATARDRRYAIACGCYLLLMTGCGSKGDDGNRDDGTTEEIAPVPPPADRDEPTVEEVVVTETNDGHVVVETIMSDDTTEVIYDEGIQDPNDVSTVDIVDTEDGEGDGGSGSDPSAGQGDGGSGGGVEPGDSAGEREAPVVDQPQDGRDEEDILQGDEVLKPKVKKDKKQKKEKYHVRPKSV